MLIGITSGIVTTTLVEYVVLHKAAIILFITNEVEGATLYYQLSTNGRTISYDCGRPDEGNLPVWNKMYVMLTELQYCSV